MPDGKEPYF